MFLEKFAKKNKFGFSLFEVVVTMSIVAIFIAACTNVFTQKYKRKVALPAHGRFECYYDSTNLLTERLISENVVVSETHPETGYCYFEPSKAASYFVVNAVGGGGAGGTAYGGSAGEYTSIFLTTTTHRLKVYPGLGATFNATDNTFEAKGADTYITDTDSNNREVIRMRGGRSSSGNKVELKTCAVSYRAYSCRLEPYCNIDNDNSQVTVGYCSYNSDSTSAEQKSTISYSTILSKYSGTSNLELSKGTLIYSYTTSGGYLEPNKIIYNISVTIAGNFTPDSQASDFAFYLDALKLDEGVATVNPIPGTGGAIKTNGGNGAVVIAW